MYIRKDVYITNLRHAQGAYELIWDKIAVEYKQSSTVSNSESYDRHTECYKKDDK